MIQVAEPPVPRPVLWTKEQYYQLGEMGWFQDRRVELMEGEIIEMAAMGNRHIVGVILAGRAMKAIFGDIDYTIAEQSGLSVPGDNAPEPDVAVYVGKPRDILREGPINPLWIIEVADSSLEYARRRKAFLYARAGISDFWIVNLRSDVLEVYRQPAESRTSPVAYKSVQTLTSDESIAPLAAPGSLVRVADLLP